MHILIVELKNHQLSLVRERGLSLTQARAHSLGKWIRMKLSLKSHQCMSLLFQI
jgi:hypothetical protein